MRLHRVHYTIEHGSSAGYSWHTSQREAHKRAIAHIKGSDDRNYTIGTIDTGRLSRVELLRLLNKYASHPDNG